MTTIPETHELLSALVDSHLTPAECIAVLDACKHDSSLLDQWNAYHVVGDLLQYSALGAARGADMAFVSRVQNRLTSEPAPVVKELHSHSARCLKSSEPEIVLARLESTEPGQHAANDGSYRWRMAAGFASLTAVCAVAWGVSGLLTRPDAPQLALDPVKAQIVVSSTMGLMVRDIRLEEQLADHRQLGGGAALQMPSGFFRNAAFEASKHEER